MRRLRIPISRRRSAVAALAMAVGLVAWTSPAAAATGDGEHQGTYRITRFEFIEPPFADQPLPCQHIVVKYDGTGTGVLTDAQNTYAGPLDVSWTADLHLRGGITYEDLECTRPGPSPVTNATFKGNNPVGHVSCNFPEGGLLQLGPTHPQVVTLEGECMINDRLTGPASTSDTHVRQEGVMGQFFDFSDATDDPTQCATLPPPGPIIIIPCTDISRTAPAAYHFTATDR